jgi:sec-independent protein translocase protein TatA
MPIGIPELGIVLVIVLLIFGPKRLPGIGRALGGGMREFKDAVTGLRRKHDDEDDDDVPGRPELTSSEKQTDGSPPDRP